MQHFAMRIFSITLFSLVASTALADNLVHVTTAYYGDGNVPVLVKEGAKVPAGETIYVAFHAIAPPNFVLYVERLRSDSPNGKPSAKKLTGGHSVETVSISGTAPTSIKKFILGAGKPLMQWTNVKVKSGVTHTIRFSTDDPPGQGGNKFIYQISFTGV
jgi:hypothetical protein